jgi:hypothetical protein
MIRSLFSKREQVGKRTAGAVQGKLRVRFPKMAPDSYFCVQTESNRIDVSMAEADAACCGVNLAFAGFLGFIVFRVWGLEFSKTGRWSHFGVGAGCDWH